MYATTLQRAWTSLVHAGPGNVLERQNMLELSLEQSWGRPGDVEQACNMLGTGSSRLGTSLEQVGTCFPQAQNKFVVVVVVVLVVAAVGDVVSLILNSFSHMGIPIESVNYIMWTMVNHKIFKDLACMTETFQHDLTIATGDYHPIEVVWTMAF